MASVTSSGPGPVVIRQSSVAGRGNNGTQLRVLLPACLLSALVHGGLLVALLFLPSTGTADAGAGTKEVTVIETKVDEPAKTADLENDELGLNPDVPTNYYVDRIEKVSVPGPVKTEESVGIPGAPDGPPVTLPPPAGIGGNIGHGAGVDSLTAGKGAMVGLAGGMGGFHYMPGGFAGRSGATRQKLVEEGGGNAASEAAVASGLIWIVRHQAYDGHWSLNHFDQAGHCNCGGHGVNNDIAGTAFGLLPLLAAGQDHTKGGQKGAIYAKNVERGLKYLLLKQNQEGDFAGGQYEMYAHSLATIAVCEAYGMSGNPMLRGPAQRSVNFIAKAQSGQGGWTYTAPCNGVDTSVGGWALMALKSGQLAGLDVPPKSIIGAGRWLDSVASADGGSYGYRSPGDIKTSMTAVGLLCREYLGWGPNNPTLAKGIEGLLQERPPNSLDDMYYYYYATQAMHHFGGQPWKTWNPKMRDLLINAQDKGTDAKHVHQRGSWEPRIGGNSGAGGRLMMTSLSILTLEVYYRHLPLYQRNLGEMK